MVPRHLLLAAHDAVCIQESAPGERVRRRPRPGQYTVHAAPSSLCGPRTRIAGARELKVDELRYEPRYALRLRLAQLTHGAVSCARSKHGRPLFLSPVH